MKTRRCCNKHRYLTLMTLGDANVINENTQVLQQTSLLDIDDISITFISDYDLWMCR